MTQDITPLAIAGLFGLFCCGCRRFVEVLLLVAPHRYRCADCAREG